MFIARMKVAAGIVVAAGIFASGIAAIVSARAADNSPKTPPPVAVAEPVVGNDAPAFEGLNKKIAVEFAETSVKDCCRQLSALAGLTVTCDKEIAEVPVSYSAKNMDATSVARWVATLTGAELVIDRVMGAIHFRVSTIPKKAVLDLNAGLTAKLEKNESDILVEDDTSHATQVRTMGDQKLVTVHWDAETGEVCNALARACGAIIKVDAPLNKLRIKMDAKDMSVVDILKQLAALCGAVLIDNGDAGYQLSADNKAPATAPDASKEPPKQMEF